MSAARSLHPEPSCTAYIESSARAYDEGGRKRTGKRTGGKKEKQGRRDAPLQIEVVEELHVRHRLRSTSPISKLDQTADIVTSLGHLRTREGGQE
jgi:hypothetical protein